MRLRDKTAVVQYEEVGCVTLHEFSVAGAIPRRRTLGSFRGLLNYSPEGLSTWASRSALGGKAHIHWPRIVTIGIAKPHNEAGERS